MGSATPYENGKVIPQSWNFIFILFAFWTAFVASYSAVRLLDHTIWRSEREREHAKKIIITHPHVVSALILGFGTVWSMHFIGMSAVTLSHTPMCYNWPLTMVSLVCAVSFMWLGVKVASYDIFAGPDRVDQLKAVVVRMPSVTNKKRRNEASRAIHWVAFCHRPQFILSGGVLAATGALLMHYTGMLALRGPFRKRWSVPFISASVVLGVVVCCVGFWILFRLLHWKVEQFWLRSVSAAVIAFAVCTLHFFGMLSVEYIADDGLQRVCDGVASKSYVDPNLWTPHQILALAVGLLVPSLALLIEHIICRELLLAYCKLKDPSFSLNSLIGGTSSGASCADGRTSVNGGAKSDRMVGSKQTNARRKERRTRHSICTSHPVNRKSSPMGSRKSSLESVASSPAAIKNRQSIFISPLAVVNFAELELDLSSDENDQNEDKDAFNEGTEEDGQGRDEECRASERAGQYLGTHENEDEQQGNHESLKGCNGHSAVESPV